MRRISIFTIGLLALVSTARADMVLFLNDLATPGIDVIIADGDPAGTPTAIGLSTMADPDGVDDGVIAYDGALGGGSVFTVNVTTGLSKPVIGPARIDLNSVNVNGAGAGVLEMGLCDTDFSVSGAGPLSISSAIGGTSDSSVSLRWSADEGNVEFGVGAIGLQNEGPFVGSPFDSTTTLSGLMNGTGFSLFEVVTITHGSGVEISSFDALLEVIPGEEVCGNGIKEPGEECDDGNTNNFDGCRNDCTLPYCGDGIVDAGEECDDGNQIDDDECSNACLTTALGCRVTGGGVDSFDQWDGSHAKGADGTDRYTCGGQAGASTGAQPQPKGEWTHHQQRGPSGSFVFHAGTASAPPGTEIDLITCSDPGWCVQARPAPAKQIDFEGVGTFKNIRKAPASLSGVVAGETFHWFDVHIEDLGEPGKGGKQDPPADFCPVEGSAGELADCDCPDFYHIRIYENADPSSAVIYEVFGYTKGGNFQIHPSLD